MKTNDDLFEVQFDVASIPREVARLKRIVEIAKGAPARIRRLNELSALYGDEPAPPASSNGGKSRAENPGFGRCPVEGCTREFHGKFNRSNVRYHVLDEHPRFGKARQEETIGAVREQMT